MKILKTTLAALLFCGSAWALPPQVQAPPAPAIGTITDGTHTVANATKLTVSGGTVGGTSPNATLTITGGGCTTNCTLTGTTATSALTVSTSFNGWAPQFITAWNNVGAPLTAGSGYAAGNTITLSGGTIVSVLTVSGGAITDYQVSTPTTVSTVPSEPETQVSTSGSGSGATFNISYVPMSSSSSYASSSAGLNGTTRLGYEACNGILNVVLGNTCLGYTTGGAGAQTSDGMGGGTGTSGNENTFTGGISGTQVTTGYWITATGHNSAGHEVDGYQSEYYGTDSGKYGLHNNNVTNYGYNTGKFVWNASHILALGGDSFAGAGIQMTVSGAANNGSGLIRLTVNSTTGVTNNDAVFVGQINGTTEANTTGTPWYVNVIDGTHLDLQGSTFVHAYTSGGEANDFPTGFINQAITGTQNNGSGLVRILVNNTIGIPYPSGTIHVAGVTGTTEANGTWTYNLIDSGCVGGGCRIDLAGTAYVNAYVSGGQGTVLSGPTNTAVVGSGSLLNAALTGGITAVTSLGEGNLAATKALQNTTVAGFNIGPTLLGSTGGNTGIILVGVNGEDVASATTQNAMAMCYQCRLANNSVQIGYRAGFINNITSAANGIVLLGSQTGFSMTGPVDVTAAGQQVGGSVCTSPTNVLLLGTNQNTTCTTATETNVIHIGAGGADIINATGTGTPATSVLTLPSGTIKLSNAFAANGAVATALSSVGPTGSHTTVQEWLTITDGSGVVRYIPAF